MQKQGYCFRLSDVAKNYLEYCAKSAKMSEGKFLDFMLVSLSAQDEFYHHENEKTDIDN